MTDTEFVDYLYDRARREQVIYLDLKDVTRINQIAEYKYWIGAGRVEPYLVLKIVHQLRTRIAARVTKQLLK